MPAPPQESLFAVCIPGLEPFVFRELEDLGLIRQAEPNTPGPPPSGRSGSIERGGILFSGTLEDLYTANLMLRCASRVLIRMPAFHAAAFSELRRKAGRLPWERFLSKGHAVALRVTCRRSRLYHSTAVAQRVAAAIQDRLGFCLFQRKWDEEAAQDGLQLILVRLVHDVCTISVDASGALLHRRGYRQATAKAPLRETLACAMLSASQWDKAAPLVDPFCGSGTLPIEAALWSRGIAPGAFRRFSFMNWPVFEPDRFKKLQGSFKAEPPASPPLILASDRDRGAIRMARENAQRCHMAAFIHFSARPFSAIQPPPGPGWMVSNPPFGVRIGRRETLSNLYGRLGGVLKEKCPGWRVTLLVSNPHRLTETGLSFDKKLRVRHGGRWVQIACGRV